MHLTTNCLGLICCLLLGLGGFDSSRPNGRATILYDAFGNSKNLSKDWAFSVLIECAGKKILMARNHAHFPREAPGRKRTSCQSKVSWR